MRTLKLTISYDGTAYHGWQAQPGRSTIQQALEEALRRLTGESVRTAAAGRTDAGVHALGQVVSFETASTLETAVLRRGLNAHLPRDIAVLEADDAPEGFHATRSAVKKRYRYVLYDGAVRQVFRRAYCWQVRRRLDAAAMHEAAQAWLGTHDFRSFETQWPQRTTSVRTMYELCVTRGRGEDADFVTYEVEGSGFLYNMVRAMVGTLVEVGVGRRDRSWPQEVVAAGRRSAAGMTAPPQGLFLVRVEYAL